MQKSTKNAHIEYFTRTDESLQRRRQNLLQRRNTTTVATNEFVFTEKKSYLGKEYRLLVSKLDPSLLFLIDEEDYDYLRQFTWIQKEKNDVYLPVTYIVGDDSKTEDYELRHVLTGGKLYRKCTNLMTVYLNRQRKDNRLSNLANIDNLVYRNSISRLADQEIYNHFYDVERHQRLLSIKKSSGNRHHRFTRRKCHLAETIEPLTKNKTNNFFSSTITYNEKKYRVGIIINGLDQKRQYKFSDFKNFEQKIQFLIDEEDFNNVKKLNWSPNFTSKIPYIRSQTKYPMSLHDFITCRFLMEYKEGEESKWTIDHMNRIPTDNRLSNLRLASRKTQGENSGTTPLNQEQVELKNEFEQIMEASRNDTVVYKAYYRPPRTHLTISEQVTLQKEWDEEYKKFKDSYSTLTAEQKRKIESNRQEALKRKEAFDKRNNVNLSPEQRNLIESNREAAIKRREERKHFLDTTR